MSDLSNEEVMRMRQLWSECGERPMNTKVYRGTDPQEEAEATGPCIGCGERNHTAHHVSICAACVEHTRRAQSDLSAMRGTTPRKSQRSVELQLTSFEAAMVLCVLAVAKEGKSQFDSESVPLRRTALENAYAKVSAALGIEEGAR